MIIGTFSGKDFTTVGSTSAFQPMKIDLTACYSGLTTVRVRFSGLSDTDNAELLALLATGAGSDVATGLDVELLDNDGHTIPINNAHFTSFAVDDGASALTFLLRYKSTKVPVTSGEATAVLYFDLSYQ